MIPPRSPKRPLQHVPEPRTPTAIISPCGGRPSSRWCGLPSDATAGGFPTLQELIKRFDGDEDVAFVAVQTAFEGFGTKTPERALQTAERYELDIPIGHSGKAGAPAPM